MKKLLCVLMAIMTVGCFAGCVDHDDGKCDECETKGGYVNPVMQLEEDEELCLSCALEKYGEEIREKFFGD